MTEMATGRDTSESADSRLTCVFWNANRRDRGDLVARLAAEKHADIVVLAEHGADNETTLDALRHGVDESFVEPPSVAPRLQVFARGETLSLRETYTDAAKRLTIRLLRYQETEFLFAAVHLPSKLNWDPSSQTTQASIMAEEIRKEEQRRGHRRTILCGDLNMNPFEDGVVQAAGLHAMMTRATANARSRTVQEREYPFFYNPMWGFFGDRTEGPAGTHYYRHFGQLSYEWNILDQVLFRPEALPWFQGDVEIVTEIGDTDLRDANGRPNQEIGSDHFPIVFRLGPAG